MTNFAQDSTCVRPNCRGMAPRIARVQALAPRLSPATPSCNFNQIFRAASFATFALRPPTSATLRMLSTDAGDQPLQTRRQALLRAAAKFDGDVGQLLVAFTEQVPQSCSMRQRCLPYTTSQHTAKCLEAAIAELERLMQLPQNDLTVRSYLDSIGSSAQ